MRIIAAIALSLALTACGQPAPAGYTPETELNFMNACRAGGSSTALCGCIWQKIVDGIPKANFDAYEQLPDAERATHSMTAQLRGYRTTCEAAPEGTGAPLPR